jgi:hypothetical protein
MTEVMYAWSPNKPLDVGNPENDDPSLLLLFQHLKRKSLQTAKGTSEIAEKLEFDFVMHNARVFFRMGKQSHHSATMYDPATPTTLTTMMQGVIHSDLIYSDHGRLTAHSILLQNRGLAACHASRLPCLSRLLRAAPFRPYPLAHDDHHSSSRCQVLYRRGGDSHSRLPEPTRWNLW